MATFLLVHGACTGGWCWEKVVPLLEANGHKVCAPDMPGLGKDHTPPANVTLADNVEKVSRLLDKMEEQVVLVGHSLGGITISAVAEARRRKLKALVYLCALLPTSGKCGKDMTSLEPDTMFRLSRQVSPDGLTYTFARDKLPALFYADVSPEDRYKAMERLRPQPLSISTTPVTLDRGPLRLGAALVHRVHARQRGAHQAAAPDGQDDAVPGHHHGMRPLALLQQSRGAGRAPRGDRPLLDQSKKAKVRVSMLSRGLGFGGEVGSSNAECSEKRARPSFIES